MEIRRFIVAAKMVAPAPEDLAWLVQALADEQRKGFAAFALRVVDPLPAAFFTPLIQAAIAERDPSANRQFIDLCLPTFGQRRVIEALLAVLQTGSNFEKAGAINALYWAQVPLSYQGLDALKNGQATPESQAAYDALRDLWEQQRCLFLQEFVRNENVSVRQSLIASLVLERDVYPAELQSLVGQAIAIARSHPDKYIRHRVEVQLGTERFFSPLPHRK